MLLATRDWGERVTTRGVTATLGGVPGHPGWVAAGKIKYRESITQGLENAPKAFIGLLKGENFGKQLVKL